LRDEILNELADRWSAILEVKEVSEIARSIVQDRWDSDDADPIPMGLNLYVPNLSWAKHAELFFLVENGDSDERLQAQNKLRAEIVEAFEAHKPQLEADDVWLSDVLALRWGRRGKLEDNEKRRNLELFKDELQLTKASAEAIMSALEVASRFAPYPDEDDYRLLNDIAIMIIDAVGLEPFSTSHVEARAKIFETFFRIDDFHIFRRNSIIPLFEDDENERLIALNNSVVSVLDCLMRASPELVRASNSKDEINAVLAEHLWGRYERLLDHSLIDIWNLKLFLDTFTMSISALEDHTRKSGRLRGIVLAIDEQCNRAKSRLLELSQGVIVGANNAFWVESDDDNNSDRVEAEQIIVNIFDVAEL